MLKTWDFTGMYTNALFTQDFVKYVFNLLFLQALVSQNLNLVIDQKYIYIYHVNKWCTNQYPLTRLDSTS